MKLETKEEYLVDSAIEMLYPTVTFNSYEAAVKHIHETPGTWRITKIYRTLPVGEEVTEADDECRCGADSRESGRQTMKATDVEIERRCGMVTGASCGHVTLSWIPGDGRNGTRSWVLATHDGDSIRRIRLSRNELGDLEDILQSIANEKKELRGRR